MSARHDPLLQLARLVGPELGLTSSILSLSIRYDLIIGTSDRGTHKAYDWRPELPFRHALIVLGGVEGIEDALKKDPRARGKSTGELFDHYLNTCPDQGSRTIRTEEALFVTLSALKPGLVRASRLADDASNERSTA